jgi:polyphosphate glucokinase
MEVLGIDIGGSGIKGAVVNVEKGELVSDRFRLLTPQPAKPEPVAETVRELAAHFNWKGPIGSGFPGVVRHSIVYDVPNLHNKSWKQTNVDELFAKYTGCQVKVVNDADAAGLAEMRFGAGKGREKGVVLMLTLGTGIGSAIFVDGHLLPNVEFGHLELNGKDAERRASAAVKDDKKLSWEEWGLRLNDYFQYVEGLIYPDLIIVGGGVSSKFDQFRKYIEVEAEIVPAMSLNNAGIIGAAMVAAETLSPKPSA